VVVRILILPLWLLAAGGCNEKSSPPSPAPASELAKRPLSADVMRAMIGSGEPCIRKFRPTMPPTYPVQVRVSRGSAGFLTLEFQSGEHPDFNDCIVAAIRAAHIAVDLPNPVDIPLAFDFSGGS